MHRGINDRAIEDPFQRAINKVDIRPKASRDRIPGSVACVRRQDRNSRLVSGGTEILEHIFRALGRAMQKQQQRQRRVCCGGC